MELFLNEKQSFNSTLVQLKGMSNSGRLKWNHSFNSTLVQLKGRILYKKLNKKSVSILP